MVDIKKEKIEPESDDDYSTDNDDPSSRRKYPPIDIKSEDEIKSEDDAAADDNNLNLFGNIVAPNLIRKKKNILTTEKMAMLEAERISQIRNRHHLHVTGGGGKQVPPLETFAELQQRCGITAQLVANVADCGYTVPTPIQMQTIPIMRDGHSLMACAPTGSGKTAAFLVPIIQELRKPKSKGFRAVILCPTRELAKQTQRECLRLCEHIGLRVHTLSKTNQAEQKYGPKSNKKFDVLVTTPNRVCHLLGQTPPLLDFSK